MGRREALPSVEENPGELEGNEGISHCSARGHLGFLSIL